MSSRRNKSGVSQSRRNILRASVGLAATAGLGRSAFAQSDQWWESIIGQGREERARPKRRRQYKLEDLRTGATPWLSDVTLQATRDAIERYRQIVSMGGWPKVPGSRSIRPGDYDDRVPVLRQRLRLSGDMAPSGRYYESQEFDSETRSCRGTLPALERASDHAPCGPRNLRSAQRLRRYAPATAGTQLPPHPVAA